MAAKGRAQFPLPVGQEVKVRIGDSFHPSSSSAYHKVQYDFKPASFSSRRPGSVEVGNHRDVTMKFSKPQSEYRGSAQLTTKDCVMVIEPDGSVTLERIWSNIRVKRTRGTSAKESSAASPEGDDDDMSDPEPKRTKAAAAGGSAELGDDFSDLDDDQMVPVQPMPPYGTHHGQPQAPGAERERSISSSGSDSDSDSDSDSSSSSSDDSDGSSSSSDSDGLVEQLDKTIDNTGGLASAGNLGSDLDMSSDSD